MNIKTAIVAEGGGQRGIYTAGVLDSLLQQNLNPFNLAVGVSAGAQNLLAFFLQQRGYAKRAISELTARPDFFVPWRWLISRSMLDLDGYFERSVQDSQYRLPYHRLSTLNPQRRLIFVATDKKSLKPVYLEPDESTALNYLKASSAVPFLYKDGVTLGDQLLVDGGVTDPLPIQYAYQQGARRILLIRTLDKRQTAIGLKGNEIIWRKRFERTRRFSATSSRVMEMLEQHEQALRTSIRFIQHPPADLELMMISPRQPLKSYILGSRPDALLADYAQGAKAVQPLIKTLQRWQAHSLH